MREWVKTWYIWHTSASYFSLDKLDHHENKTTPITTWKQWKQQQVQEKQGEEKDVENTPNLVYLGENEENKNQSISSHVLECASPNSQSSEICDENRTTLYEKSVSEISESTNKNDSILSDTEPGIQNLIWVWNYLWIPIFWPMLDPWGKKT